MVRGEAATLVRLLRKLALARKMKDLRCIITAIGKELMGLLERMDEMKR